MTVEDCNIKTYQHSSQTVLGFHGCDKSVAEEILNSQTRHLKESTNDYDWLGSGVYFWLNDPLRAYEWAYQKHTSPKNKILEPFVIGAIIDLGMCLNLCERQSVALLKKSYAELNNAIDSAGLKLENRAPDAGGFNLVRPLDCAVINNACSMAMKQGVIYDTVYGYFQEGGDAYCGAGVKEKSHIQICVRNTSCIKGYFLPRIK